MRRASWVAKGPKGPRVKRTNERSLVHEQCQKHQAVVLIALVRVRHQ